MADPQIQLHQIEKRFGNFTAVERLDLSINKGEFVVLLGPSGCGKTTTLRMIAGLESPTSGTITVANRDVTALRPGERDIAFVFQMFALYPHLSVFENIAFPLRAAGLSHSEISTRVTAVATRLSLTHLLNRKPRTLAGGDQQRVSLARALVRNPAAFLMDEPLGTLDADQREQTRAELRALHNELNATTVFVTHDQLEAMALADRIAIMNEGKLLQFAPPREIYDHPATLFVANFIGSPGMNFMKAIQTATGGYSMAGPSELPEYFFDMLDGPETLTLGIRPEYIHLTSPTTPHAFPAIVEHTELLGSHNLLTLHLASNPTTTLKARVPSDTRLPDNTPTHISLDPAGLRYFNPTTGRNLEAVH